MSEAIEALDKAISELREMSPDTTEGVREKVQKIAEYERMKKRAKALEGMNADGFPIPKETVNPHTVWHPEEMFSGWTHRLVIRQQDDYLTFMTELSEVEDYLTEAGYSFVVVDQEAIYCRDMGMIVDLWFKDGESFALMFEKVEEKCS